MVEVGEGDCGGGVSSKRGGSVGEGGGVVRSKIDDGILVRLELSKRGSCLYRSAMPRRMRASCPEASSQKGHWGVPALCPSSKQWMQKDSSGWWCCWWRFPWGQ